MLPQVPGGGGATLADVELMSRLAPDVLRIHQDQGWADGLPLNDLSCRYVTVHGVVLNELRFQKRYHLSSMRSSLASCRAAPASSRMPIGAVGQPARKGGRHRGYGSETLLVCCAAAEYAEHGTSCWSVRFGSPIKTMVQRRAAALATRNSSGSEQDGGCAADSSSTDPPVCGSHQNGTRHPADRPSSRASSQTVPAGAVATAGTSGGDGDVGGGGTRRPNSDPCATCSACGLDGHSAAVCPAAGSSCRDGGAGGSDGGAQQAGRQLGVDAAASCFRCGQAGHWGHTCPRRFAIGSGAGMNRDPALSRPDLMVGCAPCVVWPIARRRQAVAVPETACEVSYTQSCTAVTCTSRVQVSAADSRAPRGMAGPLCHVKHVPHLLLGSPRVLGFQSLSCRNCGAMAQGLSWRGTPTGGCWRS